jgi:ribulose-5-phosphate 4-epimerase/fuculose-1-phosphate aldolase
MLYIEERRHLLHVLEDLKRYNLIDAAGGLLSQRCGRDHLICSAAGGSFRRWNLGLEDFVVTDNAGEVVEKGSRGAAAGFLITLEAYRLFPLCNAVLHSHAPYSLAFAALGRPVPAAAHLAQTLGEVPCLRVDDQKIKDEYRRNPYPVHVPPCLDQRPEVAAVNQRLVPQLAARLGHRAQELERHGIAFTLYQHGIYVLARNIDEAANNLARIEAAARTYLFGALILQRERMEALAERDGA